MIKDWIFNDPILNSFNWIRFSIQINFFTKTSLTFLKIQIQIFGSKFKSRCKYLDKVQNPEFIFYKRNLN